MDRSLQKNRVFLKMYQRVNIEYYNVFSLSCSTGIKTSKPFVCIKRLTVLVYLLNSH